MIEARRTRDADLARALFEARRSLDAVLASDNPTALAVGQAYLDVQAGEESLAGSAARFRTEVESMLTGEQQIRVGELRQAAEDIAAIGSLGLVPGHTGTRSGATWFAAAPAIEGDGAFHLERRIEVHRNVPAQN